MPSLVDIVNHVATGGIDEIDIPYACSVTIRGRAKDVRLYDEAAGTDYITIPFGSSLSVDSHNMRGDQLYMLADLNEVIEIAYQVRR
jgi:hypothetical protein